MRAELEMALEALEATRDGSQRNPIEPAITAIKAAIKAAMTAPAQEQLNPYRAADAGVYGPEYQNQQPAPVQRCVLCNYQHGHAIGCKNNPVDIALAKLAQPAPVQEPVETYIHEYTSKPHPGDFGIPKGHWWQAKQYADALHTTTPAAQRQWVGLTDDEIEACWDGYLSDYQLQMIREMEAKLKEKNT